MKDGGFNRFTSLGEISALFTRTEGLSTRSAFASLLFAFFLISPLLVIDLYLRRFGLAFRHKVPELSIIVICLLLAVLSSKNGAGIYYLWHVIPSIIVYLGWMANDLSSIPDQRQTLPIVSIALACALFACVNIPRTYGYIKMSLMPAQVAAAQQSINRYLGLYRDRSSIQMGYGSLDGDWRPLFRYELVYRGQPYRFDGNTARFETPMLPFPVNVLSQMEHCKDDVWLVPHAPTPFDLWVLPNALRSTFVQNYRIDRSDGLYDAWVCDHAKTH